MLKHPLARDVARVVAVKLMVVIAAALIFSATAQHSKPDLGSINAKFLGSNGKQPLARE